MGIIFKTQVRIKLKAKFLLAFILLIQLLPLPQTLYGTGYKSNGSEVYTNPNRLLGSEVCDFSETFDLLDGSNYMENFSSEFSYAASPATIQRGEFYIANDASGTTTYDTAGRNVNWSACGNNASDKIMVVRSHSVSTTPTVGQSKVWEKRVYVEAGKEYMFRAIAKYTTPPTAEQTSTLYPMINGNPPFNSPIGHYYPTLGAYREDCGGWSNVSYYFTPDATGYIDLSLVLYITSADFGIAIRDIEAREVVYAPSVDYIRPCWGQPVILRASGASASQTYQWYYSDQSPILGQTSSEYRIESFAGGNFYYVSIVSTTAAGCKVEGYRMPVFVRGNDLASFQMSLNPEKKVGDQAVLTLQDTASYVYNIDWGDGTTTQGVGGGQILHTYASSGTYTVSVTASNEGYCPSTLTGSITIYSVLWEKHLPGSTTVKLNNRTGSYTFVDECDHEYLMDCFTTIGAENGNAVSSSYIAFKPAPVQSASDSGNPFQDGKRAIRPISSFQYNTFSATTAGDNYVAGTFTAAPFNWQSEVDRQIQNWVVGSKGISYSEDGDVLEEVNPLDVRSSAKFGYGNMIGQAKSLPYLVAHNAPNQAVLFDSFEKQYITPSGIALEDGLRVSTTEAIVGTGIAHSGNGSLSLRLSGQGARFTTKPFALKYFINGGLIKVWARIGDPAKSRHELNENVLNISVLGGVVPMKAVAQTGEWILFEILIPVGPEVINRFGPETMITPIIIYIGSDPIFIDDLRIQPVDAQVTAYVYDERTMKLLTSFDDQHFGLYYQYNSEGQLIRKQIETERGLKTIQETQYNLPKVSRNE